MQLYYDQRDLADAKKLRDERFKWLQELGATELANVGPDSEGFLIGYQYGEAHLAEQVGEYPGVRDRPDERQELINLDDVLRTLKENGVEVPTPKTCVLEIDDEMPADLTFPLFLRTRKSSWKRGGEQGRVRNVRELSDECELLRRAFGWDAPIIAREWLEIATAGHWMFGDAPQEARTWVVDGEPVAWSFHYLHAVPAPSGFPPSTEDLKQLKIMARSVAAPFRSRFIAVDFVRDIHDDWHFMEAGPGAVAGTAHEHVFKYVANRLVDNPLKQFENDVGGCF